MKHLSRTKKLLIIALAVLLLVFLAVEIYKIANSKMLDKSKYNELVAQLETDLSKASSSEDITNVITSWADSNKVSYSIDSARNIIFHSDAIYSKKNVAPTVVCTSYNSKDIASSIMPLASALTIASSNIKSNDYSVIIVNNENNLGQGYSTLSSKYFKDNANVIFLDYGDEQYLSTASYAAANNSVSIPMTKVDARYDSAIKVTITGIDTSNIGDSIGSQPNPINYLSNVLTKLKSKSIGYQLADVKVEYAGNMYPQGISFTILLDSYSIETMTTYIDGRVEKFEKSYSKDFPNASFTYKTIEKQSNVPKQVYSDTATDSLSTLIYTIKNSAYKFDSENVPEGSKVGEIYGINCITNIVENSSSIDISLFTQAAKDAYLTKIIKENATAAEMASASATTQNKIAGFAAKDTVLERSMAYAFFKSNHSWSSPQMVPSSTDDFFTECSYIQQINGNMNILHLRSKKSLMDEYTNTLLYFIGVQGNFLSL